MLGTRITGIKGRGTLFLTGVHLHAFLPAHHFLCCPVQSARTFHGVLHLIQVDCFLFNSENNEVEEMYRYYFRLGVSLSAAVSFQSL